MGRIIAITNQKGGVGKTTTAINLSACLAEAGQRVLTVDFDPQGNTTSGLGLEKGNIDNTVYELLMGECTVEECINPSVQERLDVMPSDVDLAGAEIELLDMEEKESILKKNLELLDGKYDFIIKDLFKINYKSEENEVNYSIINRVRTFDLYQTFLEVFKEAIGNDLKKIELIEALLFLTMIPLHNESFEHQLVMLGTGLEILNRVINVEEI